MPINNDNLVKDSQNPAEKFTKELESIRDSNFLTKLLNSSKLKKEVAELGIELLKREQQYYEPVITLGSKDAAKFHKLIKQNIWEDPDYYALLVYFFGKQKAVYVKQAWDLMPHKMYLTGEDRRSFRAPENKRFVLLNQVNFLRSVLLCTSKYDHSTGKYNYYPALSIEQQIIYDNDLNNSVYQYLVWAMALDSGDRKIYELFEDILYNKHPHGKVSRNIIKALLNSNKQSNWELVEKLLLSAQRQEGLRQTILEALDETSIGALQYMINVIIDNKLSRFSSVIRSIGTWTGLGWESEKETTVRSVISLANGYFTNPESISKGVLSTNNNEVYMALWVQGVLNVEKTVPYLEQLMEKGSIEKKSLALKFVSETGDPYMEMPLFFRALKDGNLQLIAFAMPHMMALLEANITSKHYIENPEYADLFDTIYNLTQTITEKEKVFTGKVFSWVTVKFEKNDLYNCMMSLVGEDSKRLDIILNHFESLNINLREKLTRQILKNYYCYSYNYNYSSSQNDEKLPATEFQREFALRILKDRGESMVASGINVLQSLELNTIELQTFAELLKRKNATLKKKLLELLLKQKDELLIPFISNIIQTGDLEQRSASLELMLQLQNQKRITKNIQQWVKEYKGKNKISEKETHFLDQLLPSNTTEVLSETNGYGVYNPANRTPYTLPVPNPNGIYKKLTKNNQYGFSTSPEAIKTKLNRLTVLFKEHSNYEYQFEDYSGTRQTVLLGNSFERIQYDDKLLNPIEKFQNNPLPEIWDQWYKESGLTSSDLFLLTLVEDPKTTTWSHFLNDYIFYYGTKIPNIGNTPYHWNNPALKILKILALKYPFEEINDFLLDATAVLFNKLTKKIFNDDFEPESGTYYYSNNRGNGWQSTGYFDVFLTAIDQLTLTDEQILKIWNIYRWRQFNGLERSIKKSMPPIYLYCRAFQNKIISEDEMYEGILSPDTIRMLTSDNKATYHHAISDSLLKSFPFLTPMLEKIREPFLDVELKRGDTATPITEFVVNFQKIYGSNRFTALLAGLGKSNLYKGYIYSWNENSVNKQQLFSKLLKSSYPAPDDTQSVFDELVKKERITETRLIEAAVYAPQWQKLISNYLEWKGLDAAIWWMHAHTKTSGYQATNSEIESEIAKYSAVDLADFSDGAVDKLWFDSAYKQLGKAKWEILYNSAKYITDGNGHRRAKLYADTLLGDLKIREVTAKVKDKRDQDYLRVYGLVPLSKANPEKDVLVRYEYLQQFKKESREFGSMKQASEALAIRIAMENLARNAGYPDPIRLTWAMETKQVQNILSKDTQVVIDGIMIGLVIQQDGKAELSTFKDDKQLKAIPAKIKKHPSVIELTAHRKTLREQWTRSKKSLEEAMIRGDLFLYSEIANLFEHPVIAKHVQKLVFVSDQNKIGFYEKGNVVNASGELIPIKEDETFRIAHSTDLHQSGEWTAFQSYCFDNKLKQPFKQIFRELYIPTPDELTEKSVSRRYAGHQVHPKQTLALLKGRGWKADYEEGLQKVFHKEGYQVKLYAMADWFSPADVESPTLETIEFHSLKDFKNIPFENINPRIFSEVMRDIDLVVSVAHVGGTDPEASQSSIEMRSTLLRETLRLFKLANVEIKGSHALIKGTMADYSIHLGSAIVHQIPGKYLSVLPVHSQHRGRLFLPFADDDPKSAEVISKIILFSKDNEIQDPTILSQIDRKIIN